MTTTWDGASGRPRRLSVGLIALAVIAVIVLFVVGSIASTYNGLVAADQQTRSQWAQVENAYQRRADLVPNLVNTVRGAANFERSTLTEVTEARARATQPVAPAAGRAVPDDPAAFQRYQAAQDQLGQSLSRLMVVVERYPELRATENFRDLQAQLEGTENRISVERMRFNESAQAFNTRRNSFPAVIVANLFGSRFREKSFFAAQAGAERAPVVTF